MLDLSRNQNANRRGALFWWKYKPYQTIANLDRVFFAGVRDLSS